MEEVVYKKKIYKVENGTLNLSRKKIKSISEIKGLDKLDNLEILDLSFNDIAKIKGLENLTRLKKLIFTNETQEFSI